MAIGDEDRFRAHESRDRADHLLVGNGPNLADHAEMIRRLQRQRSSHGRVELGLQDTFGIGEQAEDLTQVHAGGAEQLEAVRLGARQRLFMRVDASGAELLEADACHEAFPRKAPSLDLELLVINVDSPRSVLNQDVLVKPLLERQRRPGVAIVVLGIGRILLVENQANHVVGVAVVQCLLQITVNYVVGRGDDVAQCTDATQLISKPTKGLYVGHDLLLCLETCFRLLMFYQPAGKKGQIAWLSNHGMKTYPTSMLDVNSQQRLQRNLVGVTERIGAACRRAGRSPSEVTLVAVTKMVGADAAGWLNTLGVHDLGENRPQELTRKSALLPPDARWHLIGHLQRNKVDRMVARAFFIHSVDSVRLLEALEQEAGKQGKQVPVLVEVNASGEANKKGLKPGEVPSLAPLIQRLRHVHVRGLMTMAAPLEPEQCRPTFALLREVRARLRTELGPSHVLEHLSMGMSNDFEVAVEEGATFVRLGSVLFEGVAGQKA